MASFKNNHISTQWSVAIVGFLLVTVALLIPVLGQNQDVRSRAMYSNEGSSATSYGQDSRCSSLGGTCNSMKRTGCAGGSYVSGKCPGPSDWKCCVPKNYGQSAKCADLGGTCNSMKRTGCSGGSYVSNKCPGPDDWKCCVRGAVQPQQAAKQTSAYLSLTSDYLHSVGDTIVAYLTLNPQNSSITSLKFTIKYDPNIFGYGKFEINSGMFPGIKSQNSPQPGTINVELSIGSDLNKALKASTVGNFAHVGTLTLKATKSTQDGTTTVSILNRQATSGEGVATVDITATPLYMKIK